MVWIVPGGRKDDVGYLSITRPERCTIEKELLAIKVAIRIWKLFGE